MSNSATQASDKVKNWVVKTLIDGSSAIRPFRLGSAHVSPEDMTKIAQRIDSGRIKVGLVSAQTQAEVGSPAAYLPGNKKGEMILLPQRLARKDLLELRGVCMHEAMHAVNDMHKMQDTRVIDEASAHIVEAMYLMTKTNSLPAGRLYEEAGNVARLLKQKGKASEGAVRMLLREVRLYYGWNGPHGAPKTTYDG